MYYCMITVLDFDGIRIVEATNDGQTGSNAVSIAREEVFEPDYLRLAIIVSFTTVFTCVWTPHPIIAVLGNLVQIQMQLRKLFQGRTTYFTL